MINLGSGLTFRRRMARCFATLWLALISSGLLADNQRELVLLTWPDYIDETMIRAFETAAQVKIRQVNFDSDDARDLIMLQSNGKGTDLVLINGPSVEEYAEREWIRPLSRDLIANHADVDPRWWQQYPKAEAYSMPYMWGTLGIAYRQDLVQQPITRWSQLFAPEPSLQGKIMMIDNSKDLIGMALKSLGYSANSETRDELLAAEKILLAQKPYVAAYGYINLDASDGLVSGNTAAAMVFGGDSLILSAIEPRITYVVPEEGSNLWVDYWCVSNDSAQPELAQQFLDFINQPQWAARNSDTLQLATTNVKSWPLLSPATRNNPIIYPPAQAIVNAEQYRILSPRSERLRAGIISRIID